MESGHIPEGARDRRGQVLKSCCPFPLYKPRNFQLTSIEPFLAKCSLRSRKKHLHFASPHTQPSPQQHSAKFTTDSVTRARKNSPKMKIWTDLLADIQGFLTSKGGGPGSNALVRPSGADIYDPALGVFEKIPSEKLRPDYCYVVPWHTHSVMLELRGGCSPGGS